MFFSIENAMSNDAERKKREHKMGYAKSALYAAKSFLGKH